MKMNTGNQFNDELLESEGQQMIQKLVSSVPEDELSLAWRSSLNEKLLQTATVQKKKQRFGFILKPAFGLAFAGALAAVIMVRTSPLPAPAVRSTTNLEAALVKDHQQTMAMSDMAGIGLNPIESRPTEAPASYDWSEVDLESL